MKTLLLMTLALFQAATFAQEEWVSHPLTKFEMNEDSGRMKIFTPKYDYIELDCMSFINELSFVYNNSLERKVVIDSYQCEYLGEYISEGIKNGEACLKMDIINNKFVFSDKKCE